jgi:transposase
MRGDDEQLQAGMFSYIALEARIPKHHPLRSIRQLADEVLKSLSGELDALYAPVGRPSIPPERLLRALLLQAFYSVRSERLLMEQLEYNLLFRWFVGLEIDDAVWDHAVFSKNRERLLNQEMAQLFFGRVKEQAQGFMSSEHFTVDGTLLQAWASQKSFQRKEKGKGKGPGTGSEFRGHKRKNDTHASKTDGDARLYRKSDGQEARLSYLGHAVVENRHGLIAAAMATTAHGKAEREASLALLREFPDTPQRITWGGDKAYDTQDHVRQVRAWGATPHVAQNNSYRRSAIDGRTTRHRGYGISLRRRWLIEKAFGWLKQTAGLRQVKVRGLHNVQWLFVFACAAYNLLRIPKLREQCV